MTCRTNTEYSPNAMTNTVGNSNGLYTMQQNFWTLVKYMYIPASFYSKRLCVMESF